MDSRYTRLARSGQPESAPRGLVDLRAIFAQASRECLCAMDVPDLPVVTGDAEMLREAAVELIATISAHSGGAIPPEVVALRGTAEYILLVRWQRGARKARAPSEPDSVPDFPVTKSVMEKHGGRLHVVAMDDENYRALLFLPPSTLKPADR